MLSHSNQFAVSMDTNGVKQEGLREEDGRRVCGIIKGSGQTRQEERK